MAAKRKNKAQLLFHCLFTYHDNQTNVLCAKYTMSMCEVAKRTWKKDRKKTPRSFINIRCKQQ